MEDMTYIETGSLISIKENVNDILIPSEEESLTMMYPMDFEEFAEPIGESMFFNKNSGVLQGF